MRSFLDRIGHALGPLARGFDDPAIRLRYIGGLAFLLFMFPFSVLFVVGGLLPRPFAWTASIMIMMNGLVTLISELRAGPPAAGLVRFGILFVLLFAVELLGLYTGFPFGEYRYTETLRFALAGVPIAIPFAWYGTVVNTWRMSDRAAGRTSGRFPLRIILAAGLLTVSLDLVLEPMAGFVTQYWIWPAGAVPWQNYAAWFILAAGAAAWLSTSGGEATGEEEAARGRSANGFLLFGMQWVLFALTDVTHGHAASVLVSGLVLLLAIVAAGPASLPLRLFSRRDP